LFEKIKYWSFNKALKKLLSTGPTSGKGEIHINHIRTYMILFDGTDPSTREHFIKIQETFPPHTVKLLAFVQSDSDLEVFNMALYNNKDVQWNFTPKQNITDLVQSHQCDMLIHINPQQYPHLHYLAVAAKAIFKTSTLSHYPNDFNLEVNSGEEKNQGKIYQQIMTLIKTLSA